MGIGELQARIWQLEDEIRVLQRELDEGRDFITSFTIKVDQNIDEICRRYAVNNKAEALRQNATYANRLAGKIQENYSVSRRLEIDEEMTEGIIRKARNRISIIEEEISRRRNVISSLQNEISRIQEEESRAAREAELARAQTR